MTWRTPVVILIFGIVIMMVSFGTRASFGLFLQPISDDFGWGREVFAFSVAIQNLFWGLSQPIAGAIADKYGSGRVIAVCIALLALGLYLMSQVTTPGELTLTAGILVGVGLSGTSFGVILAVISRSVPEHRRSLFLGIGSAGGAAGQLFMVPLGQSFLSSYGWMTTMALLAAMVLATLPLAFALTGKRSAAQAATASLRAVEQTLGEAIHEARNHRSFIYLTTGFFVCGFQLAFITIHLPAFIVDNGVAASMAATALAVIGFSNIIGSYCAGVLGGRMTKKNILSAIYVLRSVIIAVFILSPISEVSILIFAGFMGFLWLSTVPLTSGLVADMFGVRYMATLFGIVFLSHQLGGFLGAWLGGYLYDLTGSYDVVWWLSVVLGLISAAFHLPIDERPVTRPALARS
jgi:predicted MFS family arabinose efflux permease